MTFYDLAIDKVYTMDELGNVRYQDINNVKDLGIAVELMATSIVFQDPELNNRFITLLCRNYYEFIETNPVMTIQINIGDTIVRVYKTYKDLIMSSKSCKDNNALREFYIRLIQDCRIFIDNYRRSRDLSQGNRKILSLAVVGFIAGIALYILK